MPLISDDQPRRLSTRATAVQHERSPARCRSALAASHPVSTIYNESSMTTISNTDFTIDNTRREVKLRRRTSVPVTEEEQDIVRYVTSSSSSSSPTVRQDSSSSKYNFQNQNKMIKNLTLEDLQKTFKGT